MESEKVISKVDMEKIVSLCKRRGFIYQGSEIYGGLAGTWDYGPLGVALKKNIENLWWRMFVEDRDDMYGIDAAILMNPQAWVASGHVGGFSDPMIECKKCKKRFRADHVETFTEDIQMMKKLIEDGLKYESDEIFDSNKNYIFWKCDSCGTKNYGSEPRQFNMMFKTNVGAMDDDSSVTYLRPETAGGMFVNYKNVVDSFHPKLPFGLGQIGKAFRNEIAPRDFIFRVRELEQMEIEYFVRPETWEEHFEAWRTRMWAFIEAIGLDKEKVHELEVADGDRAHYSDRTIDFEYDYPFGRKELYGLAYRTDFDLRSHQAGSGVNLEYIDEETKTRFLPHVIEPSFGLGRTLLAVLAEAYTEDAIDGETRISLKFAPSVAPVKAAVFPLMKNKPELVEKAREVYMMLKKEIPQIMWDDNGNVGKRYRRQDEIGTPYCMTVDFDSLQDHAVTVRDRDTMKQERIAISELTKFLREKLV